MNGYSEALHTRCRVRNDVIQEGQKIVDNECDLILLFVRKMCNVASLMLVFLLDSNHR